MEEECRWSNNKSICIYMWGQRIWVPWPISNIKPKGSGRGGKRPRMTKEDPKLLGEIAEDCHVLGKLVS